MCYCSPTAECVGLGCYKCVLHTFEKDPVSSRGVIACQTARMPCNVSPLTLRLAVVSMATSSWEDPVSLSTAVIFLIAKQQTCNLYSA